MLTDARNLRSGTALDADLCIIGAGAAGITIAMELLDRDLRVLLVESGDTEPDEATQQLAAGDNIGEPATTLDSPVRLDQTRLRYLGGTTNHWAGFCRPMTDIDFEERAHLRYSGWPISRADIAPYEGRAAEWVRITDADFSVSTWQRRLSLDPPPVVTDSIHPIAIQTTFPTELGRLYAADLRAAANVEVLLNANVVNLATARGNHIDRLDVRTLTGVALTVTARAYVLATGGIENARLLLASTDADAAGVGNRTDMVGRFFSEHLQIYAGFGLVEGSYDDLIGLVGGHVTIPTGRHAGQRHGTKFALGITDEHVRDAATTGMEIQMLPGRFPAGVPSQEEGVTMEDIGALMSHGGAAPETGIYLQGLAEQELHPDSRVLLGATTDALGMRRVQLDWRYSAADRRRVLDNLVTVAEAIGASGWGRVQLVPGGVHADAFENVSSGELLSLYRSTPGDYDPTGFVIGMGFHHMCTTRMSTDPSHGVVDANCRMHEVDNLWVAGSSVFGTGATATPTFTVVALAVRLADHLIEVLL